MKGGNTTTIKIHGSSIGKTKGIYMIEVHGERLVTNEDGFLKHAAEWSREVAVVMAKRDQLELTDDHWSVILFMRKYYADYGISPPVRTLYKAVKIIGGDQVLDTNYLYQLFLGGRNQAIKYAGLPKPTGCF